MRSWCRVLAWCPLSSVLFFFLDSVGGCVAAMCFASSFDGSRVWVLSFWRISLPNVSKVCPFVAARLPAFAELCLAHPMLCFAQ